MANVNAPFGLRPINNNGTPYTGQLTMYNIPSSVASNVFIGDPVIPNGDGDAYGVASAILATAGTSNYLIGSVVAIVNGPAAGANAAVPVTRDLPVYHQASTNGYVLVADDPNTLFAVQDNNAAFAATDLSLNVNLTAGSGGSTTTGISSWTITTTGKATTNTLQMRLMRVLRGPSNVPFTAACTYVCRINLHSLWNQTGI